MNASRWNWMALVLLGCGGPGPLAPLRCEGADDCQSSADCPLGQVCGPGGCCLPAAPYEPSCEGTVCCDQDVCIDYAALCANGGGCTCVIAGTAASTTDVVPMVTLSTGEFFDVDVRLLSHGDEVLGAPVELALAESEAFVLEGARVRAMAAVGVTVLSADYLGLATCSATLVNLGSPEPGAARVVVTDGAAGTPIAGAWVLVHDGVVALTDTTGVAVVEVASQFDVSVLFEGHDYVTVIGVSPGDDLHVALPSRSTEVGVASGTLDFAADDSGSAELVRLGMVASSFELEALASFDLGLLLGGPMLAEECSEAAAGCYDFAIPPLFEARFPSFGGLVITMSTVELKPSFDVTATPGRRRLFALGAEADLGELAPLVTEVLVPAAGLCACDDTALCDACSCDADCGPSLASRFLRATVPLLSSAASGARGPIDLPAMAHDEASSYLAPPYGARPADGRVALLDTPGLGPIVIEDSLAASSELAIAPLPIDPALPDHSLDAVLVLHGRLSPEGFVPSGIGVGFDCLGDECRGPGRGGSYDGVAATALACADGDHEPCAPSDGRVAVVRAALDVEPDPERTILIALALDDFEPDALRASMRFLEGPLGDEEDVSALPFPPFAGRLERHGRLLQFPATAPTVTSRIVILEPGDAAAARWTVIGGHDAASIRLPLPPAGLYDPLGDLVAVRDLVIEGGDASRASSPTGVVREVIRDAAGFSVWRYEP